MQHHRFTNHEDGSDPDHYTMEGPAWQRPLRWVTVDFNYLAFYARRFGAPAALGEGRIDRPVGRRSWR